MFLRFDKIKGLPFHRPIGGGIAYQETSHDTIARETYEEIGYKVENLNLLGLLIEKSAIKS